MIRSKFDFTPFEFGAWQGVKSFFPTEYLGSAMDKGSPVNDTACVLGFDRARQAESYNIKSNLVDLFFLVSS